MIHTYIYTLTHLPTLRLKLMLAVKRIFVNLTCVTLYVCKLCTYAIIYSSRTKHCPSPTSIYIPSKFIQINSSSSLNFHVESRTMLTLDHSIYKANVIWGGGGMQGGEQGFKRTTNQVRTNSERIEYSLVVRICMYKVGRSNNSYRSPFKVFSHYFRIFVRLNARSGNKRSH